jgi:hypothetical protein
MSTLLAPLAQGNPTLQALLPLLFSGNGTGGRVVDSDAATVRAESDALREQLALHCEQAQATEEKLYSTQGELVALRERTDTLAAALGACCLCWGADSACRVCRGRGRPGFSQPDEESFVELVLPAVRAMRMRHPRAGVMELPAPPGSRTPREEGASAIQTPSRGNTPWN